MSDPTADSTEEGYGAFAVRPFLSARSAPALPEAVADEADVSAVRGYLITGGRSVGAVQLEFETMLAATASGRQRQTAEQFERARVLELCDGAHLSVAELAATMKLPIGVVRVVAADLLAGGLLERSAPTADIASDTNLIARLIAGVRAL